MIKNAKEAFENPTAEYIAKTIRVKGEDKLLTIQNPYTDAEAKTWDQQLAEATAFLADNNAATPLITAMATARSIAKAELVTKIMGNANAFRGAAGIILGQQQKFLDDLKAATQEQYKDLLNIIISW